MFMHPWIRLGLVVALVLGASTARAADNYVLREVPLAPSSLNIQDARPAKELKGGLPLLFDPTYSVPDKRFTPPLLDVWTAALEEKLGDRLDGKERVDAVRFRLAGRIDGTPFSVELAEPYDAGKSSGMVYNGANARAATVAIVQRGIEAGVEAVLKVLEPAAAPEVPTATP